MFRQFGFIFISNNLVVRLYKDSDPFFGLFRFFDTNTEITRETSQTIKKTFRKYRN